MNEQFYVYILTNKSNKVLYTGVTNNLRRRVIEHKEGLVEGFTKRYMTKKLVYFEAHDSVLDAIAREKQIKGGSRERKQGLVNRFNPQWQDLYEELQ